MEAIRARRAVRSYTQEKPSHSALHTLLSAAVQAPSAMNAQPWIFAVVQDAGRLKRYSDEAKALLLAADDPKVRAYESMLRNEAFNIFYDATTLVVIGVEKVGTFSDADCWLAAQNLMLAAVNAGLGTCCIGFAVPILNTSAVKAELGIPEEGAAMAPLIVGYPSVSLPAIPRAEPKIVSWSR